MFSNHKLMNNLMLIDFSGYASQADNGVAEKLKVHLRRGKYKHHDVAFTDNTLLNCFAKFLLERVCKKIFLMFTRVLERYIQVF